MTSKTIFGLTLVALAAAAAMLGRVTAQDAAPAAPLRIAVCDITTVNDNYQRVKDLTADMAKRRDTLAAEDATRKRKVEALQLNLEALAPGSDAYEKMLDELDDLATSYDAWKKSQENRLVREHRKLLEQLYTEIIKTVEQVATAQGYQLVLYRDAMAIQSQTTDELLAKIAQRKVLYNSPSIDITSTVLAKLNEGYKARGDQPRATSQPATAPR